MKPKPAKFCTNYPTIYVCLLWPTLLLYVLNKCWCQLREHGKITAPEHVLAM